MYNTILISGCGPVGRALDLGSRCREFESPHSDQKRLILEQNQSFLLYFGGQVKGILFSDHISSITDRKSKRTARELNPHSPFHCL